MDLFSYLRTIMRKYLNDVRVVLPLIFLIHVVMFFLAMYVGIRVEEDPDFIRHLLDRVFGRS